MKHFIIVIDDFKNNTITSLSLRFYCHTQMLTNLQLPPSMLYSNKVLMYADVEVTKRSGMSVPAQSQASVQYSGIVPNAVGPTHDVTGMSYTTV